MTPQERALRIEALPANVTITRETLAHFNLVSMKLLNSDMSDEERRSLGKEMHNMITPVLQQTAC